MMDSQLQFSIHPYNGYALQWSPFFDGRIALAASTNFGLVGNGRLAIFRLTANGIEQETCFDTQDALYDVAWSEVHENQAIVASGDGSIRLFDTAVAQFPVQTWQEHHREVYGVAWNLVSKDTFASSSWDGTVKIWSPHRPASITTLPTHSCTYGASFSPHEPSLVSTVSSDSHLRLFDLRSPASARNHLVALIPIHGDGGGAAAVPPSECLTHDWNKYRPHTIATAGVDTAIRIFDVRGGSGSGSGSGGRGLAAAGPCVTTLRGHEFAVRRLAWSPHQADLLLTGSYDMTCGVWSDGMGGSSTGTGIGNGTPIDANVPHLGRPAGRLATVPKHTEFVTGVDWCLFGNVGWCASTGWDGRLLVWNALRVVEMQSGGRG